MMLPDSEFHAHVDEEIKKTLTAARQEWLELQVRLLPWEISG